MLKEIVPSKNITLRPTDKTAIYVNQMVDLKRRFPKQFHDLNLESFNQLANYCIENYLYLMLQQAEKTGSFDNLEHTLKAAVATDQMSTDIDRIKRRLRMVDVTTEKIWYAMVNFTLHFVRTSPDDWKNLGSIHIPTDEEWEVDQKFLEYLNRDIKNRQLKNKGTNL